MSSVGYIQVHAFASRAQFPLNGVAIQITDDQGKAVAMRLTNRSGILDKAVEIPVPDLSAGQSPDTREIPYATVDMTARLKDYERIEVTNIQVFPGIVTVQNLEMIPLAEFPDAFDMSEEFDTSTQNL